MSVKYFYWFLIKFIFETKNWFNKIFIIKINFLLQSYTVIFIKIFTILSDSNGFVMIPNDLK